MFQLLFSYVRINVHFSFSSQLYNILLTLQFQFTNITT